MDWFEGVLGSTALALFFLRFLFVYCRKVWRICSCCSKKGLELLNYCSIIGSNILFFLGIMFQVIQFKWFFSSKTDSFPVTKSEQLAEKGEWISQ